MRKPIPVKKQMAIALWFLVNEDCYYEKQEQFGIGLSTVGEIVLEAWFALELDLFWKMVCLSQEDGKAETMQVEIQKDEGSIYRCPGGQRGLPPMHSWLLTPYGDCENKMAVLAGLSACCLQSMFVSWELLKEKQM
ncbi:UNVERIFIED_CONTAM: hypothetical protein K2H54_015109 [Gekko kuhli]